MQCFIHVMMFFSMPLVVVSKHKCFPLRMTSLSEAFTLVILSTAESSGVEGRCHL